VLAPLRGMPRVFRPQPSQPAPPATRSALQPSQFGNVLASPPARGGSGTHSGGSGTHSCAASPVAPTECDASSEDCAICNAGGFLIVCDGCGRYYHFACAGLDWPPDGGFSCAACTGASPPAADPSAPTFSCCLCFEDLPLAARVTLDGCTHVELMCSACVFNEMSRHSQCPLCRAPVALVQHVTTGRTHAVAEVRRDANDGSVASDGLEDFDEDGWEEGEYRPLDGAASQGAFHPSTPAPLLWLCPVTLVLLFPLRVSRR
jgi:hypothetical protein